MRKGYSEAIQLLEESEPGTVEYIVRTNKSSKKSILEDRYVFVLPCNDSEERYKYYERVYNQILDLKIQENPPELLCFAYDGVGGAVNQLMTNSISLFLTNYIN